MIVVSDTTAATTLLKSGLEQLFVLQAKREGRLKSVRDVIESWKSEAGSTCQMKSKPKR